MFGKAGASEAADRRTARVLEVLLQVDASYFDVGRNVAGWSTDC